MNPVAELSHRETALLAAEWTCPRCGAARDQGCSYCIDCGLRLPELHGTVASLRHRWVRRIGWYPGDWVWLPLLTLVVAAVAAAAAIVVSQHRAARSATLVAPASVPSLPLGRGRSSAANGRLAWPAGRSGWTAIVSSYPEPHGRKTARATAERAVKAHLPQVGTLDSSNYASLNPGYDVVFSGIYGSAAEAQVALKRLRQAGFSGAHIAQIAR